MSDLNPITTSTPHITTAPPISTVPTGFYFDGQNNIVDVSCKEGYDDKLIGKKTFPISYTNLFDHFRRGFMDNVNMLAKAMANMEPLHQYLLTNDYKIPDIFCNGLSPCIKVKAGKFDLSIIIFVGEFEINVSKTGYNDIGEDINPSNDPHMYWNNITRFSDKESLTSEIERLSTL